jgi:hypothetical protein
VHLGCFNPSNWLFHDGYYDGAWYVGLPSGMQGTCLVRTPDLAEIAAHQFFDGTGFNQPAGAVDCAPGNNLVGVLDRAVADNQDMRQVLAMDRSLKALRDRRGSWTTR